MTGDELDKWMASKCANKVDEAFVEAKRKGRGIAAFICEPCFVSVSTFFHSIKTKEMTNSCS